ncbi:hypothetical protein Q7P37_000330 [Cladosporium fusiforme]
MRLSHFSSLLCAALAFAQANDRTIERDIAIIGGGPSGTYAAVHLRDKGKSVVVVEKQASLGGHVSSYIVPGQGFSIEYGVQVFTDAPTLRKFFSRFDLGLVPASFSRPGPTNYADFSQGTYHPSFSPSIPDFDVYFQQRDRYPFLDQTIELPTPVPEDLSLPFGEFVKKYGLEDEVFAIYTTGTGLGDLLSLPTLYVFKHLSRGLLAAFQPPNPNAAPPLVPQNADNQEIFRRAGKFLGSNVLLSSTVTSATRNSAGVTLKVRTPSGTQTIKAKKLLIAFRPTLDDMKPFGLDSSERGLFSQFEATAWYVALVENTGLTDGESYRNVAPDEPFDMFGLPGLYSIVPTASPGVFWIEYGAPSPISDEQVKADIVETIIRLRDRSATGPPRIIRYESHTPFQLTVSPKAIQDGFYNELSGLQGHKKTFYTGSTFTSPSFTSVLNFTDSLIPELL